MSTCPISGCRTTLRPGLIMCGGHWKLLPAKVRVNYLAQKRTNEGRAANVAIASARARLAAQGGRERWARGEPLKFREKGKK